MVKNRTITPTSGGTSTNTTTFFDTVYFNVWCMLG
jgi:hypothetical protein